MERGWDAKGLLRPLWERLPGKRDELAVVTGIRGGTLSSYNSGKRLLGQKNARLIANALGVSLEELGAPPNEEPQSIGDRLRELAETMAEVLDEQESLHTRLVVLEARAGLPAGAPKGHPAKGA